MGAGAAAGPNEADRAPGWRRALTAVASLPFPTWTLGGDGAGKREVLAPLSLPPVGSCRSSERRRRRCFLRGAAEDVSRSWRPTRPATFVCRASCTEKGDATPNECQWKAAGTRDGERVVSRVGWSFPGASGRGPCLSELARGGVRCFCVTDVRVAVCSPATERRAALVRSHAYGDTPVPLVKGSPGVQGSRALLHVCIPSVQRRAWPVGLAQYVSVE